MNGKATGSSKTRAPADKLAAGREQTAQADAAPLEPSGAPLRRARGFMAGQIAVPADFDRMGDAKIDQLFGKYPSGD